MTSAKTHVDRRTHNPATPRAYKHLRARLTWTEKHALTTPLRASANAYLSPEFDGLWAGKNTQSTCARKARAPHPADTGMWGTTSTPGISRGRYGGDIMTSSHGRLHREPNDTNGNPEGEDPEQGTNTLPGYPEGWDPLVDGPLEVDGSLAKQMWRDWQAAEDEGNEWAARWAWERYSNWMLGKGHDPAPKPKETLSEQLARMYRAATIEGNHERAKVLMEIAATPKREHTEDARYFLGLAFKHGRSRSGWYVRYPDGLGELEHDYLCERHCPKPYDGAEAVRDGVYPVKPHEVFDGIRCAVCGVEGEEIR